MPSAIGVDRLTLDLGGVVAPPGSGTGPNIAADPLSAGFAVLPGSVGTLNELFLAWTLVSVEAHVAPPLVLVGEHWNAWLEAHRHPMLVPDRLYRHVCVARTADEGARLLVDAVRAARLTRTER